MKRMEGSCLEDSDPPNYKMGFLDCCILCLLFNRRNEDNLSGMLPNTPSLENIKYFLLQLNIFCLF